MSIGISPEMLSQIILVGRFSVGRLGVLDQSRPRASDAAIRLLARPAFPRLRTGEAPGAALEVRRTETSCKPQVGDNGE